jgi:hypothetical protein
MTNFLSILVYIRFLLFSIFCVRVKSSGSGRIYHMYITNVASFLLT